MLGDTAGWAVTDDSADCHDCVAGGQSLGSVADARKKLKTSHSELQLMVCIEGGGHPRACGDGGNSEPGRAVADATPPFVAMLFESILDIRAMSVAASACIVKGGSLQKLR